jgi:hypothetical protein
MSTTNLNLEKCPCQHCNTPLEFERENAGTIIECPNCNGSTILFAPPKTPPPAFRPDPPVTTKPNIPAKRPSTLGSQILSGLLFLLGLGLLFTGCTTKTETAMHQIYAAINYCTGFLLIAIACLMDAVLIVARRP